MWLGKQIMVSELNPKPTVLKIGGSAITFKEKPLTPNLRVMKRIAKEIAKAKVSRLLIVHGGGSFGHPIAREYAINEGFKDQTQNLGFCWTHNAMVTLNNLFVNMLIQHCIPAVGVAPSSCILTKHGRIHIFHDKAVTKFFEASFVPVLYGDAVMDLAKGFSILSGDQLVSNLALRFEARQIIMGVDVDGLYTADPKEETGANLIPELTLEELKELEKSLGKSQTVDVTGGMLGKVRELIPVVEKGISVSIVNATKPNRIYKALKNKKVLGTYIQKG
jgi:isopentenyl phosphate kinase